MDRIDNEILEMLEDGKMIERRFLPDGRNVLVFWVDGEKDSALGRLVTNDGGASCVTYHSNFKSYIFMDINVYMKYPEMAEFMLWHELGHVYHNHAKRRQEMKEKGHDFGPDGQNAVIPEFEREADEFAVIYGGCSLPTVDKALEVIKFVKRRDKMARSKVFINSTRYFLKNYRGFA